MKFIVEFTCRVLYSHNGALFSPPTPLIFIWSSYTLLNVFWDSLQCFLLCLSVIISWHPHTRNWRNTVLGFFFCKIQVLRSKNVDHSGKLHQSRPSHFMIFPLSYPPLTDLETLFALVTGHATACLSGQVWHQDHLELSGEDVFRFRKPIKASLETPFRIVSFLGLGTSGNVEV